MAVDKRIAAMLVSLTTVRVPPKLQRRRKLLTQREDCSRDWQLPLLLIENL